MLLDDPIDMKKKYEDPFPVIFLDHNWSYQ